MKKFIHGGDLDAIEEIYKIKKEEIIDFSSNINPLKSPLSVKNEIIKNINVIETYPDKEYIKLKNSILNYVNLDIDVKNILVGNGATELISSLIKSINPKNSLIVYPTYSEYEREIKKNNGNIKKFFLKEENDFNLNKTNLLNSLNNIDLLIICNPNNPTGTLISIDILEDILKVCKNNNTFVMIDETYIEFNKNKDTISAICLLNKYDNLFVIRGTSKFFSIAGLRLGYAFCSNKNIVNKINYNKELWSVNSLASLAGVKMFNDKDFIERSLLLINNEKSNIYKFLNKIKSLKFYESYSNFILVKILKKEVTSNYLFEKLIKDKILIRDVSSFEGLNNNFFRFCILTPEENKILMEKLKNIV